MLFDHICDKGEVGQAGHGEEREGEEKNITKLSI